MHSGHDAAFLSLSGILFVGNTAEQRYLLHEHLKDLGLAGPPAPILQWEGHLQRGAYNTHALPFRSLSVLPAELLVIPVPTTSWAFQEMPVMSFTEWEAYRQRTMSTVLLTSTANRQFSTSCFLMEGTRELLAILVSLWQLVGQLLRHLPQWCASILLPTSQCRDYQQCSLSVIGPGGRHRPS